MSGMKAWVARKGPRRLTVQMFHLRRIFSMFCFVMCSAAGVHYGAWMVMVKEERTEGRQMEAEVQG